MISKIVIGVIKSCFYWSECHWNSFENPPPRPFPLWLSFKIFYYFILKIIELFTKIVCIILCAFSEYCLCSQPPQNKETVITIDNMHENSTKTINLLQMQSLQSSIMFFFLHSDYCQWKVSSSFFLFAFCSQHVFNFGKRLSKFVWIHKNEMKPTMSSRKYFGQGCVHYDFY